MGTINEILLLAKSQVGYDVKTDPKMGSKYGRWYAKYTGDPTYAQNGVSYCAMYISWLLNQTNTECPYFPNSFTFDMRDKSILGDRYVDKNDLKIGDIASFDWPDDGANRNIRDGKGDHAGLVIGVFEDYIKTNEGNTDNGKVKERIRFYSDIICGVRPYYKESMLTVNGIWDVPTTYALQKDFGTYEDGVVSGQSAWTCNNPGLKAGCSFECGTGGSQLIRAMQRWLNVEVDGYFGPITMAALMRKMGVAVDSPIEISNPSLTVKEMQRRLITKGTIR